jgi:nicotinamide-nucleotide amidase
MTLIDNELDTLASKLHQQLKANKLMVATAESCTGGWIAKILTNTPGSSATFERGFVTYSNEAKQDMLNVKPQTLQNHGAVSEQTVLEMAQGALQKSRASVAIAVSGIAGPTGGSEEKPVGTVWLAWSGSNISPKAQIHHFSGDRDSVRYQAVKQSLLGLIERLPV